MLSAVTEALLNVLRAGLPPLLNAGQIGLRSPADTAEGCLLGLFPYSTPKDTRYQMTGGMRVDGGVQLPPFCLEMHFFVTSYAGKKSGLADDYKILERVMQIWPDICELPYSSTLQPAYVPAPRIEFLSPDADAVSKIWQFPGEPYRLSLFYKCAPIAIPSGRHIPTTRVGAVDYTAKEE